MFSEKDRSELTPDKVIDILRRGNDDFINNRLTVKNTIARVRNAASGQYPVAAILSCLDSRVPVEDIFHCGIGDVFVARVAGNIVNPDILGSMEIACKIFGAKLIVVLGHGNCGAIRLTIDQTEAGNITGLLNNIKPAVVQCKMNFTGETNSFNPVFVDAVCRINVELMIKKIRGNSSILKEMEDQGKIKIVGGIYAINSGKVDFF